MGRSNLSCHLVHTVCSTVQTEVCTPESKHSFWTADFSPPALFCRLTPALTGEAQGLHSGMQTLILDCGLQSACSLLQTNTSPNRRGAGSCTLEKGALANTTHPTGFVIARDEAISLFVWCIPCVLLCRLKSALRKANTHFGLRTSVRLISFAD